MAQRSISSNGVTATLWAVVEEIDDDDEDILEVTIDVVNDSNWDLWDISGDIRAMDGTHAHPRGAPDRIGSGDNDEFKFWVPSTTGAWLFKIEFSTDSGAGTVELGPFANDLRIAATSRPERISKEKVDSSMKVAASVADPMAAAFGSALDGFGDEETINPELQAEVKSNDPMQAAFAGGLLASQEMPVAPSPPPSPPPEAISVPPSPVAPSPPPSAQPPAAPSPEQFGQPTGVPTGPPTGPPPSSPPPGPSARPPGPPPSGSPPGPPPKSGKPPGPPPS
ncbi:MAG: hypothetical protein VYB17_02570 [Candidatus Thermoplasmatota archaeon]|nr:hypothetical protein [Candidatus Thermoplasmatota archaeon]